MATETIKESNELLPPEDHPDLGTRAFSLLSEILEHRKTLNQPAKWSHWYGLGRNRHWKAAKVNGVALVSANLLHRHRTRTVNMLTGSNPSFEVARLGLPEDYPEEGFQTILRTCDDWWRNTEQQPLLDRSITNGETYGTTIEKVIFNPDINHSIGEVDPQLLDPFYFGVYPPRALDNQRAEGNFHFYPLSVRECKRRWPDKATDIQADDDVLAELGDTRTEAVEGNANKKGLMVSLGGAIKELINSAGGSENKSDQTLVLEAWVRDYTKVDGKPKYVGNIRRVTALNCGKVVVDDRSNPSMSPVLVEESPKEAEQCYLWERFPFIVAQSGTDTASLHGMSDFEQLEGLQRELNKSLSQFNLSKDRAARSKLINPKNSGVKNEDLTNYPSIINPVNEMVGSAIRYMDPPQDYGDLLKAIEFYRDFFMEVAGTFDLDQARSNGNSVISHKAIAELIEQASVMSRNKIRSYTRLVRERGRMYISLAQNWYTEDRYVNYQEAGEQEAVAVNGKSLLIPARITVVSGSTLPVSRVQIREEAIELHKAGVIDQEELLKSLEWANWKKVIQRMQAGPLAEAMEMLKLVGVPDELVEYFAEIVNADPKDLEKAMKEGEVPPFMDVLKAVLGDEPEKEEDPTETAELAKAAAEVEKKQAEAELVREKVNSEIMEQQRIKAGIAFDQEKLKLERAKVANELRNQGKEPTKAGKNNGPYAERGGRSNNKT